MVDVYGHFGSCVLVDAMFTSLAAPVYPIPLYHVVQTVVIMAAIDVSPVIFPGRIALHIHGFPRSFIGRPTLNT